MYKKLIIELHNPFHCVSSLCKYLLLVVSRILMYWYMIFVSLSLIASTQCHLLKACCVL
jgi:hypothetical protein